MYYKNFPGEIEGRAQIYVPVCFVCSCLVDCRKWKSGTGKLCLQSVPGYGISGTGVIVLQGVLTSFRKNGGDACEKSF